MALNQQFRCEEAELAVRRALEIAPADTRVLATLGSILLQLGQIEEACNVFGQALEIDPDFPMVRSNLLFAMSHDEATDEQELMAQHRRFGKLLEDKLHPTGSRIRTCASRNAACKSALSRAIYTTTP